jgi:RNA polymerase sigma-70 factor, ECF subfamily
MTSDVEFPGPDTVQASSGDERARIDDLVATYGRLLFDLAYRLTGDLGEAEELSQEILVRCCLAVDHVQDRTGAVATLYRDLLLLWKGRARRRRLKEALFGGPPASRGPGPGTTGHPPFEHLQPRLMRLDPDSRAILALRVGEGLDYEEIASVLGIPLDAVRSHLALARRRVRRRERFEGALEEMANLYLDGRLKRAAQEEFERRVGSDAALRDAIEFHRGLTLEFREESPSFPRDFLARTRARLEQRRATGGGGTRAAAARESTGSLTRPAPAWWRRFLIPEILAGIAAGVMIAAVLYPGLLRAPKETPPAGPVGPGERRGSSGDRSADADRETRQELHSLGYLAGEASGKSAPRPTPARPGPAKKPAGEKRAGVAAAEQARPGAAKTAPAEPVLEPPRALPSPEASPAPSVEPAPSTPVESSVPPPAEPSPASPAPLPFRVAPLPKAPDAGREHQVIRTAAEWAAFAEGLNLPAPEIAFDREMMVVLRGNVGSDPPSRLIVVSVTTLADALEIRCRVEPVDPAAAGEAAPPGVALIVPSADLPIRIVMK